MAIAVEPARTTEPEPLPLAGEQRVLLYDVPWAAYEAVGEALRDRPGLRLTYDGGVLEIMTTSAAHEWYKSVLGRLIETLAEEWKLPIRPGGSTTFKRLDLARGLEPDECFWLAHEPEIRGRMQWDPAVDPPPDLAIEIEMTRSAVDRMVSYAALGGPEVWRFDGDALQVCRLQPDGSYQPQEQSPTFPGIPVREIARFLQPSEAKDYLTTIREFRVWVRERMK